MPAPRRELPPSPSVESLRKQAKQLRKSFQSGDAEARARVRDALGEEPQELPLRAAQRIVSNEYGFAGWSELRAAVDRQLAGTAEHQQAAGDIPSRPWLFLDLACLTYSDFESPLRIARARRILAETPEIAEGDPWVAAATGDRARLQALLDGANHADRVNQRGGPRHWPPLLYLCYARVPQVDALGSARLLLERGADAGAFFMWPEENGPCKYTALTGVFGHGESGSIAEPPHPDQRALARLLLAHGADPNDGQTLYNCHFGPDDTFLEILFEAGLPATGLGPGLLTHAAGRGFAARIELLLAHGCDPNARTDDGRSAYECAELNGQRAIAERLVRAGAARSELSARDSLLAACLRTDREAARGLWNAHPELHADPTLLLDVVHGGNLAAVKLLLELGAAPAAANAYGVTPLHSAANLGHEAIVHELLARGVPVDVRDSYHDATPADMADHASNHQLARVIADRSRDVPDLVFLGHRARLAELLAEDPRALAALDQHGRSVLHHVNPHRTDALELVHFLLQHGAPLDARSESGETALARFLRLGAHDLADTLIEAGASE